jgi:hypothetical protein
MTRLLPALALLLASGCGADALPGAFVDHKPCEPGTSLARSPDCGPGYRCVSTEAEGWACREECVTSDNCGTVGCCERLESDPTLGVCQEGRLICNSPE